MYINKNKRKSIDLFQRRILRTVCMNIRWPKKVSNEKLPETAKVKQTSVTMKICQMKWFWN